MHDWLDWGYVLVYHIVMMLLLFYIIDDVGTNDTMPCYATLAAWCQARQTEERKYWADNVVRKNCCTSC